MTIETKNQLIELLEKSKIASEGIIAIWCKGTLDNQAKTLARQLIDNGHLTKWQAKQFLGGRHKIKFGNHILLNRISKDQIGTQYVAQQVMLDRQVKLTFLNEQLSKKLNGHPELVRQIAGAADFHHANLEHLHLIEKDGTRYYLVTDYVAAKSLNDPNLITSLNSNDLSNILTAAFQAFSKAHRHGLSHGALSEEDFLIDEDKKLTIQNTVLSYLVHSLDEKNMSKSSFSKQDVEALVRISRRLVSRLCDNETSKSSYEALFKKVQAKELSLAEASSRLQEINASTHRPQNKSNSDQIAQKKTEFETSSKSRTAMGQSIIWIVPTTLTVLTICGYLGYANGWLGTRAQTAQKTTGNSFQQELPSLSKTKDDERKKKIDTDEESEEATSDDLESIELHSEGKDIDLIENDITPTQENPDDTQDSIFKNDLSETSNSTDAASLLGKFKALTDVDNDSTIDSPDSVNSKSDLEPTKDSEQSPSDTKTKLTDFPQNIALPNVKNTGTLFVGELPNDDKVNLKLISDSNISPGDVNFSIRGESPGQWNVLLIDESEKKHVASISLTEKRLEFRWTDTARDNENASFLANCVLKIEQRNSMYVSLRKPIRIQGFNLDRKKPTLRVDVQGIEYAPREIFAQVDELDEDRFGQIHYVGENENRHFTRKKNLEIQFSDLPEYQMIFLTLSSDLKKRMRLDASLKLRLDPARRASTADAKSLESAKKVLESAIFEIQQRHDYLKDTAIDEIRARFNLAEKAYPDKKRNLEVKQLKTQLELAKERSKKFNETLAKIEPFFENAIPVTIYFSVNGRKVVLASSMIE